MAWYRVRAGKALPHHGGVVLAGESVELPEALARDSAIAHYVDSIPDPVAEPAVDKPIMTFALVQVSGARPKIVEFVADPTSVADEARDDPEDDFKGVRES